MEGEQLKYEGMNGAIRAAPKWSRLARNEAIRLGYFKGIITSEDVTDIVGLPTGGKNMNANNAVGAVFSGLARSGIMERRGFTLGRNPQSHASLLATWVLTEKGMAVARVELDLPEGL